MQSTGRTDNHVAARPRPSGEWCRNFSEVTTAACTPKGFGNRSNVGDKQQLAYSGRPERSSVNKWQLRVSEWFKWVAKISG